MIMKKTDNINKSFLAKSWEKILLNKINFRIPQSYLDNKKILYIKNKEDIQKIKNKNLSIKKNVEIVVILYPLNKIDNLINFLNLLDKRFDSDVKIIINFFSNTWKYIFYVFNFFGFIKQSKKDLFFSKKKFSIFLNSTSYEISEQLNPSPIPIKIPLIFPLLSLIVNIFPFLSIFSFARIYYLRKKNSEKDLLGKLSIIIPCKNEEDNIENIIIAAKQNLYMDYELCFINDLSTDKTNEIILDQQKKYHEISISIVQGLGKGKLFAVEKGIQNSSGIFCIILDADLTIKMEDINLFYSSITKGNGDLINGTRLIYNLEKNSMKAMNIFGNIFFAKLVSYIIGKKITDTLCGTKCFKKNKWELIKEFRLTNKLNDRWGDFNIIFGMSFYGNKVIDLPVRYYERLGGKSKMNNRFDQFLNMITVCLKSLIVFKIS